ncbi:MAG: hypothetical protein M3014_02940, partial [Chloroflexota bacterium]|nr:hypothetical protein [Chloroflexota bacterium]
AMSHPCYLGVDTARREELIAHRMSVPEIARHIGADSLGYLSLPGLFRAVGKGGETLCSGCFTGLYPVPVQMEFLHIDSKMQMEAEKTREQARETVGARQTSQPQVRRELLELDLDQRQMDLDRIPVGADH